LAPVTSAMEPEIRMIASWQVQVERYASYGKT
jgi:hypothetical protein